MTSPATTTSERRKNTSTSPSVCAAGACRISIGSSLNHIVFRAVKKLLLGHISNGSAVGSTFMRLSRFSCAMTIAPVGRSCTGLLPPPPWLSSGAEPGPARPRGATVGFRPARPSRALPP